MSQFYASIQGNRGMATRQGTKNSGISGHIRGWQVGAEVRCYHDEETGLDTVVVYKTGGSSEYTSREQIAKYTKDDSCTWHGG